jgi:hypothetical protein
MSKLIGNPSGEGNTEALDYRHDIIGNADRFVWHIRIVHT